MTDVDDRDAGARSFPPQRLPYSKKGERWRRECVDWAARRVTGDGGPARKSAARKAVNRDLVAGRVHLDDMRRVVAPDLRNIGFRPEDIQHYPIINPKINLLVGEERKRVFEHRVVVTNPNGVSEVERARRDEVRRRYEEYLGGPASAGGGDDEAHMARVNEFMAFEWQDARERRANALLDHYAKEQNFDMSFNSGFHDAIVYGEEMYICDIVGGEPLLTRLDPMCVHAFRRGDGCRLEDADVVAIESYWSPGKVTDWFHGSLSADDLRRLDSLTRGSGDGEEDAREAWMERLYPPRPDAEGVDWSAGGAGGGEAVDAQGNVRVLRVFWKSRKKILKVKGYDPVTGETTATIYPEGHKIDKTLGEEAEELWVNEAWEGTLIGADIYVDIRPRRVQYGSMGNPSRCHFGIIGTMYSFDGRAPFSLVDMMKPYNYLYDIIHDRLNKLIARSWGAILRLDLAQVPAGWDLEKWMYFARESGVAVTDSFKEGLNGAAAGKLAGGMNNNTSGVINLNDSASIAQDIQLLQFIQQEMSSVVGISAQREGAIDNRETVGGVERATVQSSHITEWLFSMHNDTKKRVCECFLETAKAAMRGGGLKFRHLLGDGSMALVEVGGDEFAECDYGLVVDYGNDAQRLRQGIETLAQAALQNQTLSFSTIMKLYNSGSLAEKQRLVEKSERDALAARQQAEQRELQARQAEVEAGQEAERAKMESEERMRLLDAETRVRVAEIEARARVDAAAAQAMYRNDDAEAAERRRQFDERMELDRRKLDEARRKAEADERARDRDRDAKAEQARRDSRDRMTMEALKLQQQERLAKRRDTDG